MAAPTMVQAAIKRRRGQLPKNLPSPPIIARSTRRTSPILLLSATSGHAAADHRQRRRRCPARQQISQISGVAQVTIGGQQKPRYGSRSTRPSSSPRACRWRTCALRSRSPPSTPRRAISTATPAPTPSTPRPVAGLQGLDGRHCRLPQRGPLRIRDIGQAVTGPEDAKQAGVGQRERGVFLVVSSSRRQRHRDRRQDQGDPGRGWSPRSRLRSDRGHQRSHPDIRLPVDDVQVHFAPDHRPGRDGDLHLPAQFLATVIPTITVRWPCSAPARFDVGVRYTLDNLSADGI